MITVILDPGHGGEDPGAVGFGLQEKDIALKIARYTRSALAGFDVNVVMTRDDDITVPLKVRAQRANMEKADFFLSIHVNAGGGSGFESYIHTSAAALTERLRRQLHTVVARFYVGYGMVDRGMKSANFYVLRETVMPAVLLENLFIDNPREAALLADDKFLAQLGQTIADGLVNALGLPPRAEAAWNPEAEIEKLRERKVINTPRRPEQQVTWGELATVINRILDALKIDRL